MHVDKHVVKMILEYAQILSTAHRVLDGKLSGKRYMFDDIREDQYYKATHVNHPSTVWARSSMDNYIWLSNLFVALCTEYTNRYGKVHKTAIERTEFLMKIPVNINRAKFNEPPPAMPVQYIVIGNSVQSYRNYYNCDKRHLFSWKNRQQPNWIV